MLKENKKNECYGCSMTGVRRAVAFTKEAVVIFHSPQSCSQVIREKDSNTIRQSISLSENTVPVIATNISSEDVIFGAHKKLEECLKYVAQIYAPEYIVVGNSCVAGIIGDDVTNIAKKVSKEIGLPVFTVPCFGFMNGGYEEGLLSVARQLIEYYVRPLPEKFKEVTLIGIVDKNRNYEYLFIKEILNEWGFKINCIFPGEAKLGEIKRIGSSSACILCSKYNMVNNPYQKIAAIIEEKIKRPILNVADPIGYEKALIWIKEIGAGLKLEEKIIARTKEALNEKFIMLFEDYRKYFSNKRAIIYVRKLPELTIDLTWFLEIIDNTGIEVIGISFAENISVSAIEGFTAAQNLSKLTILTETDYNNFEDISDYVFTLRMDSQCKKDDIPIPYVSPPFGIRGIGEFLDKILKVEMKKRHRGRNEKLLF